MLYLQKNTSSHLLKKTKTDVMKLFCIKPLVNTAFSAYLDVRKLQYILPYVLRVGVCAELCVYILGIDKSPAITGFLCDT